MSSKKAKVAPGPRRGRPPKVVDPHRFLLILPGAVVENLDAWVDELKASTPGGSAITRADLIRDLLAKALEGRGKKGKR